MCNGVGVSSVGEQGSDGPAVGMQKTARFFNGKKSISMPIEEKTPIFFSLLQVAE
jgi:hypothetical protein